MTPPPSAASAADDLSALADDYWEAYLRAHPVEATILGDRRFDDRLEDPSPAAQVARRAEQAGFLARARALPAEALGDADRLTRDVLVEAIGWDLAKLDADLDAWTVDPLSGPQVFFLSLPPLQPVVTMEQGEAIVRRWRAMRGYIDAHMANLRRSLGEGRVAVREPVERVIQALDGLAARPLETWAILDPIREPHPDWPAGDLADFRADTLTAVREGLAPAFDRYRHLLAEEILPAARPGERAGIVHLAGGGEAYRQLVHAHTTLALSPAEVHEIGLQEVARINAATEEAGRRALGAADRAATVERLRTDPALRFSTREEIVAEAEACLARARAAIPAWFGRLPRADCVVLPIAQHEERDSTIAYYWSPAEDGSRPGQYYVNTYAPETRPRFEARTLAYHESIPGHHLQIAIAQELTGLPAFRRHLAVTAFEEGWGLYSERLADEMGLYDSDLDRLGVLSFDAWRACRLVVDTGIHALGWSRQRAIDYMTENSPLAVNNIVNEVDRYIVDPGQALAYKMGQLEILRLREAARAALGERFDIRAFHDAALEQAAVPLSVLAANVARYVERAS
ncbi:MAG: DUF885 domain-containing protein [Candidatus Limnocylindrales bacterium]